MTVKNLYPTIRPSLDLNFARAKSLDPRVSFVRSSIGTYVGADGLIKTARANVPRFDYSPTTGESLGLLVEEQRTNLIVQSENLGTTWTTTGLLAFGSGSTLNATVAPDGATTADLVTENTSTSEHRVETAAISWAANTTYTLTIFAKANGRTRIDFFGVGGGNFTGGRTASFNLSTGTVISTDGAVASIEARANGWYRVRMTLTASAAPSASSLFIRFLDNSNNFSYTGDGTSGMYFWGAQLEVGAFPTSYIPTVASTATRAADVASITGSAFSSWYSQSEGTIYHQGRTPTAANFFIIDDGTVNNRITSYMTSATAPLLFVATGGVAQANLSGSAITAGSLFAQADAYKAADFAIAVNGGTVFTSSSGSVPVVNKMIIGANISGGAAVNGTIRRLTYWPVRLPDATLQQLTQS